MIDDYEERNEKATGCVFGIVGIMILAILFGLGCLIYTLSSNVSQENQIHEYKDTIHQLRLQMKELYLEEQNYELTGERY